MLSISIIICCYNSTSRLPETLAHLLRQQATDGIDWEVLVIDNASTDNTAKIAIACWPDDAPAPLRVIPEPKSGLSNDRKRGIYEAKYDIVSFVDDDNWVCEDWVRLVSETMTANPEVGACGGPSEAVCEIEPPEWFEEFKGCYAVVKQADAEGDVTKSRGWLWGAGLNFRKDALFNLYNNGFYSILIDRKGTSLTSGGDNELCYAIIMTGWRLWYEPRLKIKHFIPKERLTKDYIMRWFEGAGKSKNKIEIYSAYLDNKMALCLIKVPWYKLLYWNLLTLFRIKKMIGSNEDILNDLKLKAKYLYTKSAIIELLQLNIHYKSLRNSIYYSNWVSINNQEKHRVARDRTGDARQ